MKVGMDNLLPEYDCPRCEKSDSPLGTRFGDRLGKEDKKRDSPLLSRHKPRHAASSLLILTRTCLLELAKLLARATGAQIHRTGIEGYYLLSNI